MGLHGNGLWGSSCANTKGTHRVKCPICGKIEVTGYNKSKFHHHKQDENGKWYIDRCPKQCPNCGGLHYNFWKCSDCGYENNE